MKARFLLIVVVFMFVASLFFAVSSEAKIDPKVIAAMWLLDEGNGDKVKDDLGVGNNGTLKNNPKWVAGKFGKALEFDGANQYVDCGNDVSLDLIADFTIVSWINYEDPKHAYDYSQIVSRTDSGGQGGVEFGISAGTGKLYATNGPNTVRSNTPLKKSEWVHVATVYSGKTLVFYANGEEDGGGDITFPSSNQPTGIGRSPARDLLPYKGIIDDVAVFTQALTKTDVKNIMNQGLERALGLSAVFPSGKLVATWANIKAQ
jgi:hypothetical protein